MAECQPDWLARTFDALDPDGSIRASLDAPRPAPAPVGELPADDVRVKRARAYLSKMPGGVQGQNGSGTTYAAACAMVHGFALSADVALDLLLADHNPKCQPPWTVRELLHKVEDAAKKEHAEPRGYLLARGELADRLAGFDLEPDAAAARPAPAAPPGGPDKGKGDASDGGDFLEQDDDPYRIARGILAGYGTAARRTLAYWRSEFYAWDGARWQSRDRGGWTAAVSLATRRHFERVYRDNQQLAQRGVIEDVPKMGRVTRPLVSNVVGALEAETLLDCPAAPAWVRGGSGPDPAELVAMGNGLVHLPAFVEGRADAILAPSPLFFNLNAADYPVALDAPAPAAWLRFLAELWPDDPESVALLQEWFGYLITPDTSQQKMLLLIGPKRSGKGTISAVLRSLVGPDNCCGPTLSGLAGPFGLAPLLGKSVALVDDARLSARADGAVVSERLLLISGEARSVTVERKHLDSINCQIKTRFVVATNEAPRLADLSGALASRWSVLQFTRSFYGHEDRSLVGRLLAELPGIFRWAAAGWDRLRRQGQFSRPTSAEDAVESMEESGSPIGVFLKERCEVGAALSESADALYSEWISFCADTGRKEPGNREEFGRQLRAALPTVKRVRCRTTEGRTYQYRGLRVGSGGESVPGVPGVPGSLSLHALFEEKSVNYSGNTDLPGTPGTPGTDGADMGVDL